ncbi:ERIC3 protein, partial [Thryothorus ludovicianus]|nr:ERIC3 protein [Thryothorus ludovicianus]
YRVPVVHRCVVPMPPSCLPRGDRRLCAVRRGLPVERWFHPTTAFNEQLLIRNNKGFPKSPLCSNAFVTMAYLGKSKHVSLREYKDEIKVYQQYCGTENICVYKGELLEGDTFQFTSKRYLGFPFSLTFYLNGIQVERLSCCCEYRGVQDKRRSQLRRRNSYFRVLHAAGAPPCYKCLVAMGLDKKLCPPKRKARRFHDMHVCCWGHAVPCASSIELKSKEDSESVTEPGHEVSMETVEETLETGEESSKEE